MERLGAVIHLRTLLQTTPTKPFGPLSVYVFGSKAHLPLYRGGTALKTLELQVHPGNTKVVPFRSPTSESIVVSLLVGG